MSAWRRVALQLFPEQRRYIQNNNFHFSVYQLFFDLLLMALEAHKSKNHELLHRIYKYAEWCWSQKGKSSETYNAVCVAFYEHLVDEDVTYQDIPFWIKPAIFDDIRELLRSRMPADNYQALLSKFNSVNQTNFS